MMATKPQQERCDGMWCDFLKQALRWMSPPAGFRAPLQYRLDSIPFFRTSLIKYNFPFPSQGLNKSELRLSNLSASKLQQQRSGVGRGFSTQSEGNPAEPGIAD